MEESVLKAGVKLFFTLQLLKFVFLTFRGYRRVSGRLADVDREDGEPQDCVGDAAPAAHQAHPARLCAL